MEVLQLNAGHFITDPMGRNLTAHMTRIWQSGDPYDYMHKRKQSDYILIRLFYKQNDVIRRKT